MRTASPILALPHGLGPSSPPHTPTAPSPPPFYAPKISSEPGSGLRAFSPPLPPASLSQPPNILPVTTGHISFNSPLRNQQLSPYSSHSSDADISEPEPELPDDGDSRSGSPPPLSSQQVNPDDQEYVVYARVAVRANFDIEELSDFDEDDMDGRTDIIHPHTIEYAESTPTDGPLDRRILSDLQNLQCCSPDLGLSSCSESSDLDEEAHEVLLRAVRERERRHRMSKSSGTKRTMSERGSDESDREDVRGYIGFEEVGSSARRLRQRIAGDHRRSLVFQDPPPRIEEVVEPEELEGLLSRELPFFEYTTMQVDSPRSPYD